MKVRVTRSSASTVKRYHCNPYTRNFFALRYGHPRRLTQRRREIRTSNWRLPDVEEWQTWAARLVMSNLDSTQNLDFSFSSISQMKYSYKDEKSNGHGFFHTIGSCVAEQVRLATKFFLSWKIRRTADLLRVANLLVENLSLFFVCPS